LAFRYKQKYKKVSLCLANWRRQHTLVAEFQAMYAKNVTLMN
jgi:hypothetical protein